MLLKLFQTTSVAKFNEVFHSQELEYLIEKNKPGALPDFGTEDEVIDDLLKQAKSLYVTLSGCSEWTGVNTTGSHSTFSAEGSGRGPCWHCGKNDHLAAECPLPVDQRDPEAYKRRQAASKQEWRAQWSGRSGRGGRGRRGNSSGHGGRGQSTKEVQVPKSGKWAQPSKSEHNHRSIEVNGALVAHHWDSLQSRWIPESTATTPITQVLVPPTDHVPPNSSISVDYQQSGSGTSSLQSNLATDSIDAAANAARQTAARRTFATAMDAFMDQLE
jgi:hypothetical protein